MDRLNQLQKEIDELRKALNDKEDELYALKRTWNVVTPNKNQILSQPHGDIQQYSYEDPSVITKKLEHSNENFMKLPRWAIERYSRQILLPDIGVDGQQKLCNARMLIVGAGGLGCPAASYLAGAGVGEIGIVDYDTVDHTNIHRQLLYTEQDQFMNKVDSAAYALRRINSNITITPYSCQLDSTNALNIISKYNIVLDCTDNVPTRYLLNDACVLLKKPLISGSALKMEGQLTVYNYRTDGNAEEKEQYQGPCYRCLFSTPPPPETVGSCSAQGVAGPIPGAIGCLQALEAIKVILGKPVKSLLVGRMLLFDGEDTSFRTVKLRGRNSTCLTCSDNPTVTELLDYEQFCKTKAKEKDLDLTILSEDERIHPKSLSKKLTVNGCNQRHLLVDIRSEPEFQMCHIDGSVNYPIDSLENIKMFNELLDEITDFDQVTFICRRGNDSQIVARRVLNDIRSSGLEVNDVIGGLHGWSKHVDHDFPIY